MDCVLILWNHCTRNCSSYFLLSTIVPIPEVRCNANLFVGVLKTPIPLASLLINVVNVLLAHHDLRRYKVKLQHFYINNNINQSNIYIFLKYFVFLF
jgi:hypothetical protein